jgi:hypothetical protein
MKKVVDIKLIYLFFLVFVFFSLNYVSAQNIGLDWIYPTENINVSQIEFFNVTVNVSCNGANCGAINVSLDPIGPSNFSYLSYNSTEALGDAFSWEEIVNNGGDPYWNGTIADDSNKLANIPFNFPFHGTNYTTLYVSSNGRVHFTSTSASNTAITLPVANVPVAAPVNKDMYVRAYTKVFVKNDTNPTRIIVEYENLDLFSGGPINYTYQLILYDTGKIKFQYNSSSGLYSGTGNIGINFNASDYLLLDTDAPDTYKGLAVSFYPPGYDFSSKGGVISMDSTATPFYTNITNPYNLTLNNGESQVITWYVNATGTLNNNYSFFVFANLTSNVSVGNITSTWNVTIADLTAPVVNITYPNNITYENKTIFLNYTYQDHNSGGVCWNSVNDGNTNSSTVTIGTNFSSLNASNGGNTWVVYCNDSYGNEASSNITFSLDLPLIGINLITPTKNINATLNGTFDVSVNVSCSSNNCGEINVTLDPASQPISCKEILDLGQSTGNGTYTIYPFENATALGVYCDMESDGGGWTLVFGGKGSTTTYASTWAGWYSVGNTVNLSLKGVEGKSQAYDYVNFTSIMLETNTSSGARIVANVSQMYDGLINLTGPNPGSNNGNATWNVGLRGNYSAHYRTGTFFELDRIAIWQGDGTNDANDRVVFSTATLPTADWGGNNNRGAIGGEFRTSKNIIDFFYVFVRENTTYSSSKGIISTVVGTTPFYTNVTNPYNLTLNKGESQVITWSVNATGDLWSNHTFFVYLNRTNDLANGNVTAIWNVTIVNFTVDFTSPSVSLNLPSTNTGQDENVSFVYSATDINNITNCSLYVNNAINQSNLTISKGVIDTFALNKLSTNIYNWTVNCTDEHGNVGTGGDRSFSVVKLGSFLNNESSTNLSSVNIGNITNLVIASSFGLINYTQNIDLSSGVDVGSNIVITSNNINVNSNALPILNKTAKLKLYGLTFSNPEILRDGVLCNSLDCLQESYNGGVLSFNVSGFSVYSSREISTGASSGSGGGGGGSSESSSSNQINLNPLCEPNWICGSWSYCSAVFTQSRICNDKNNCGVGSIVPEMHRICPNILFDAVVKLKTKKKYPWSDLSFEVNLKEINNSDLVDIKIIYRISKNGISVYEESETKAIQNELVFEKIISDLELPPGEYVLTVVIEYGINQTASAEQLFSVIGSTTIFIFMIIVFLLIILGYGLYRSNKRAESVEKKLARMEKELRKRLNPSIIRKSKNWIIEKIENARLKSISKSKLRGNMDSDKLIKELSKKSLEFETDVDKIEEKRIKSVNKSKSEEFKDSDDIINEIKK